MIKKRLKTLDALRGIAIILVMLYHYCTRYYQIYPQENQLSLDFYNGKYGVQLFFIISGFVIFMSLTRIKKPIDFIVHRFIRLYPTFWFSVLFTFMIVSIFGLPGREVTIFDMFINLTMIAGQFKIPSVDGVYWTLIYELKFYFWILVLFTFKKIEKIETITMFFMLFIIISILTNFNHSMIYKLLNQIFIFDYMSFFISGIIFYKIFYNQQNIKSYIVLCLAFIIGYYQNHYENSYMLFVIYGIFILLSLHKLNWLANKPLIFLGSISYGLYLVHQNIGYMILNYTFSIGLSSVLGTIIAISVSLLVASFITFYIEKKSMILFKKLYTKYEKRILQYIYTIKYLKVLG